MDWITDNYGSKRGMLRHLGYWAGWRFHPLTRSRVDLSGVDRLVFVCKGNICRSALAQAVADSLHFPACSFGYLTTPGKSADPGMSEAARVLGLDLSGHVTTRVTDCRPAPGDLMLFFEFGHCRHLAATETKSPRMGMLGMWGRPRRPYIHDPFGRTRVYYSISAGLIQQAVVNLVHEIRLANSE